MTAATALIADDEPLLRERLAGLLATLWPELQVVAQARNGREAVSLFETHRPQVAFLDVHMPGMNGIEAAQAIGRRADVVFVTAFDQYAVEAFRQGAVDYVVKPVAPERLAETVARLRGRHAAPAPAPADGYEALLAQIAQRLRDPAGERLKWIKASVGQTVRLIPVEQVLYLKSDTKYPLVAWEGGEALIRRSLREMADSLDPVRFVQVHRSALVNLDRVSHFVHAGEGGEVHFKGRADTVPVSRSYTHLFRE